MFIYIPVFFFFVDADHCYILPCQKQTKVNIKPRKIIERKQNLYVYHSNTKNTNTNNNNDNFI